MTEELENALKISVKKFDPRDPTYRKREECIAILIYDVREKGEVAPDDEHKRILCDDLCKAGILETKAYVPTERGKKLAEKLFSERSEG